MTEILYENEMYKVVQKARPTADFNYDIINKDNGVVEAEMKALPNAVEAAVVLQMKMGELTGYVGEDDVSAGEDVYLDGVDVEPVKH
jgi:hypothetical protein